MLRYTPSTWLLSLAGGIICYQQYATPDTQAALLAWQFFHGGVVGVRLMLWLWWTLHPEVRQRWDLWSLPVLGTALLLAAQWGGFALVIAWTQSERASAILHMTLVAVTMGGTARMAGFNRSMATYVALVMGPMVLYYLWLGSGYHLSLALLMGLSSAFALFIGRTWSKALYEIQRQRQRNDELVLELREEAGRSEAARQKALSANLARSRLFAAANHDMRQPLYAMNLLVQTLKLPQSADLRAATVDNLADCVNNMSGVIDDLLDFSRLDGDQIKPHWSTFDLAGLVRECCQPFEVIASVRGLELKASVPPVQVHSDRNLLSRVLSNLVSNAVRYTPHGQVHVRVEQQAKWLRLDVQDTGIGIAPQDQGRIFEEFFQVHNAGRNRRQGMGLGLFTAKRLSDLLSLNIRVRSTPGLGSTFSLDLPLAGGHADPRPVAPPLEPPLAEVPSSWAGRRVLVVEDDADSRHALLNLLRAWQLDGRAVTNPDAAGQLVSAGFLPAALVADLRLANGESGMDAVHRVRAAAQDARLPVLIVTGDVGSAAMQNAVAAGFDVAGKPVPVARLQGFLAQAFQGLD